MYKKVLVTGGAGFIGANLVRKLIEKGEKVHILQKKESDLWRIESIKTKLAIHETSLNDKEKLRELLNKIKPEVIYHLAAHGAYAQQKDIDKIIKTNIFGSFNLILASRDIPYRVFINTGSSAEYGIKNRPMKESDFCKPVSFYAASKLSATLLGQVFAKRYDKPIVTLRPFSVYGPYEDNRRFIPTVINSILRGKKLYLTKRQVRHDYVYVEDAVSAYIKTAQLGKKLKGKVINIGTGKEYTNREIVKLIEKISEKKAKIGEKIYPARSWDNKHWVADNTFAKKILNWEPKYSLKQGLQEAYNWYIKHRRLYVF